MIINFTIPKNLILASHITGVYDVNRNETLINDDYSLVSDWAQSIINLNLQGVIFHNNFSDATCKLHENENIHFVRVAYNPQFNPNVFRYFIYSEFLKVHAKSIENVFFTDISDVMVLKNPFQENLFLNNPKAIFCGDEPKILENEWMINHSENLRNKISDFADFENKFKNDTLLNCGVFGGNIAVMHSFIDQLWNIHEQFNYDNKTAYTGDMGAFNYLVKTRYSQIIHGNPVNTEFKKYNFDYSCWFKHK